MTLTPSHYALFVETWSSVKTTCDELATATVRQVDLCMESSYR